MNKQKVARPVYNIQCHDCEVLYVGDRKVPDSSLPGTQDVELSEFGSFPPFELNKLDHSVSLDNVNILTVENQKFERGMKEVIHIHITAP